MARRINKKEQRLDSCPANLDFKQTYELGFAWVYSFPWSSKTLPLGTYEQWEEAYEYADDCNERWLKNIRRSLDDFSPFAESPISGGRTGPDGRPKYLSFRRNSTGRIYWYFRPPWFSRVVSLGRDERLATEYAEIETQRRADWEAKQKLKLSRHIKAVSRLRKSNDSGYSKLGRVITEFSKTKKRSVPLREHRLGIKPKLAVYHRYLSSVEVEDVDRHMLRIVMQMEIYSETSYLSHRNLLVEFFNFAKSRAAIGQQDANFAKSLPTSLCELSNWKTTSAGCLREVVGRSKT